MSLGRTWRAGRALHAVVAVGVGVSSGAWLFGDPVRRYFESEAGRAAVAARESGGGKEEKRRVDGGRG